MTTNRPLRLIGAASSAGAYGPGQEAAPGAFRRHGLVSALEAAGCRVVDVGDVAHEFFGTDPDHVEAANIATVAKVCQAIAAPVAAALAEDADVLVLGGDCTAELGTMMGALEGSDSVGLVYIDGDTDLNTPATGDGILDWMGVAHMLALPGAEPRLAAMARRSPMLPPEALRFVAADNTNDAEQRVVDVLGLHRYPLDDCLTEPAAVVESLTRWSADFARVLIHVDIDVLDGAAFPIADNTRTIPGLTLPVLSQLLQGLCQLPNFAALTLCEINPNNARNEDAQFGELIKILTRALAQPTGSASV